MGGPSLPNGSKVSGVANEDNIINVSEEMDRVGGAEGEGGEDISAEGGEQVGHLMTKEGSGEAFTLKDAIVNGMGNPTARGVLDEHSGGSVLPQGGSDGQEEGVGGSDSIEDVTTGDLPKCVLDVGGYKNMVREKSGKGANKGDERFRASSSAEAELGVAHSLCDGPVQVISDGAGGKLKRGFKQDDGADPPP